MRNITGQAVIGDDLYGREYELNRLWEMLEQGEHVLMLAPRRVGKTSLMLELRRAPRENWDVFYIDVEACKAHRDRNMTPSCCCRASGTGVRHRTCAAGSEARSCSKES